MLLDVAEDETLGSILKRAGTALAIEGSESDDAPVPTFIAFFDPDAAHVSTQFALTVVDEDGRARWNVPYHSIKYGEILQTHSARALAGDPTRLYYVTYPGVGNGVAITFALLASGLKHVWDLMQVVATVEDNISLGQRFVSTVRERLGRGADVVEHKATGWEMRGADPHALYSMLGDRPWTPEDLAALLGCDPDEAAAMLWAFGYAESNSGVWRAGADDEALWLRTLYDEFQLSYSLGHPDYLPTLEARVRHHLTHGERAPRPFIDAERFGDELEIGKEEAWDPGAEGVDGEFDIDEPSLPLEHMLLKCACGKPDCAAIAGFGLANGGLKLGFVDATDHFVVDAMFMVQVAVQTAEAIDEAKDPRGPDASPLREP